MIEYHKMLVTLDGSKLSETVMPFAQQLAKRLNLNVTFLNVFDSDENTLESMHRAYIEIVAENFRQRMAAEGRSNDYRGLVTMGHPAEEILDFSKKDNSDLILMATHGSSGLLRWAFGGVADKVLKASHIPIWLVKAANAWTVNYDEWPGIRLLVPLDGSSTAEKILPHVESMVKQRGVDIVDVVLLKVCDKPSISADYPFEKPSWEEHVRLSEELIQKKSGEYLKGIEKRLSSEGLKVRSQILMGNPAVEIVKYAADVPFSLVAMTTHGLSGMTQWSYGSVAAKIISGLSCPILLLRPK